MRHSVNEVGEHFQQRNPGAQNPQRTFRKGNKSQRPTWHVCAGVAGEEAELGGQRQTTHSMQALLRHPHWSGVRFHKMPLGSRDRKRKRGRRCPVGRLHQGSGTR